MKLKLSKFTFQNFERFDIMFCIFVFCILHKKRITIYQPSAHPSRTLQTFFNKSYMLNTISHLFFYEPIF